MVRFGTLPTLIALAIAVHALGISVPETGAQQEGGLPLQLAGVNPNMIVDLDQSVRFFQLMEVGCCSWYEPGAADESAPGHADGSFPGSSVASMNRNRGVNLYVINDKSGNITQFVGIPFHVEATGGGLNKNKISEMLLNAFFTSDCSSQFTRSGYLYSTQTGSQASTSGEGGSMTLTWEYANGLPAKVNGIAEPDWCITLYSATVMVASQY
jgi:hypothetical protein